MPCNQEFVESQPLFYGDTTKHKNTFDKKKTIRNVKITYQSHAYKGYASTYDVENSNSFDPEIQLKNKEPVIKEKLRDLLPELIGFKFVTTLVIEF